MFRKFMQKLAKKYGEGRLIEPDCVLYFPYTSVYHNMEFDWTHEWIRSGFLK
ncbi:MAG: hypothetical protein ACE5ES_00130 [Candidatus Nanoarchaeia archaeon]